MGIVNSASLEMAVKLLGKEVEVVFDRPLGSRHPKHGYVYEVNYGYVAGIIAPDGEELDAYYLGADKPLAKAKGIVRAVVHRIDDDDDKLVVMPPGHSMSDDEIEEVVAFQERWFTHRIVR